MAKAEAAALQPGAGRTPHWETGQTVHRPG